MSRRPRLVLTEERPDHRWRIWLVLAVAWAGSLFAMYAYLKHTLAPGTVQLERSFQEVRVELRQTTDELEALKAALVRAERGEQVAKEANASLSRQLSDRQSEVSRLRADLTFFQRLVEGGAQQRGLAVYGLELQPTANPSVYRYVVTLTQNLAFGQVTKGAMRLQVSGVRAGKRERLGLKALGAPLGDAQSYEFKYFQQLEGSVMLPAEFTPDLVQIQVENREGERRSDREFSWQMGRSDDSDDNPKP